MHLWLADRLTHDPLFFREAHIWKFDRDVDTTRDVLEFKIGGIIPPYVRSFAEHVQQKETEHAGQTARAAAR